MILLASALWPEVTDDLCNETLGMTLQLSFLTLVAQKSYVLDGFSV